MTTTHVIIIVCSILVLGILHIFISMYKMMNKIEKLGEYLKIVNSLSNKTSSLKVEDITKEALWVLSNTDLILEIVKPVFRSSIDELKAYIVVNNSIGINDYSTKLSREIVSWVSKIDRERLATRWQLLNPFIWFYRGIELVTKIVLGYPIKQFYPSFDYDSKPWKAVNLVFTIVSGLSSIIALYLTIKG